MSLKNALEEKQLDLRLRDKLLAEGKLTKAQLDEYTKKLADETENAVQADEE